MNPYKDATTSLINTRIALHTIEKRLRTALADAQAAVADTAVALALVVEVLDTGDDTAENKTPEVQS